MSTILDAATQLIAPGVLSGNQSHPAIQVNPRLLLTCIWLIAVLDPVPPAQNARFDLQISTTQGGSYTTIASFTWVAGQPNPAHVHLGLGGNVSWNLNNQSAWIRCSVVTSGAVNAHSWLSKATSGGIGIGKRGQDTTVNAP
jgi:hypothetical protein